MAVVVTVVVLYHRYDGVPFFWTQQYGKSLRYAGHALNHDDIVTHGTMDGDKPSFTVYYTQGQTVRSVSVDGGTACISC